MAAITNQPNESIGKVEKVGDKLKLIKQIEDVVSRKAREQDNARNAIYAEMQNRIREMERRTDRHNNDGSPIRKAVYITVIIVVFTLLSLNLWQQKIYAIQMEDKLRKTETILAPRIDSLDKQIKSLTMIEELLEKIKYRVKGVCYVGISTGNIPSSSFSASSTHPDCPLANLPLNSGSSWCAYSSHIGEWVQVNLKAPRLITGVVTQGRHGQHTQYVTTNKVIYGNSLSSLQTYQENDLDKIFYGNKDVDTPVENRFLTPIKARYIRIYPITYNNHMSMRLELLDC